MNGRLVEILGNVKAGCVANMRTSQLQAEVSGMLAFVISNIRTLTKNLVAHCKQVSADKLWDHLAFRAQDAKGSCDGHEP
jgi:predicted AlkP superfamily phosphohydrolase/phosphomutase